MSDYETLGGPEVPRGPAVGSCVISFNDGEPDMELIGFDFFDTEEGSITWHWDNPVITEIVVLPLHRIKQVRAQFMATGD